jgi:SnoaL-like domain
MVQYWERFFAAFPDLDVRDEFKAEDGDTAINEWSMPGTNAAALETPEGTISATGKRWRFADATLSRGARDAYEAIGCTTTNWGS